jgi:hypothetical protein
MGYAPEGELLEEAQQAHPPIILDTKGKYVVVLGQARVMAPSSERTVDLPEAFVFKVRDEKVIETWMFHQDTVAILDLLKQAEQQKHKDGRNESPFEKRGGAR